MDFNVLSRLESHSHDLFRLGERRLQPIREGEAHEEHESLSDKPKADKDYRALPPSAESPTTSDEGDSFEDKENIQEEDNRERLEESISGDSCSSEEADSTKRHSKAHYEDLWAAITRNIGKGFVLGYVGKVGINLLYPILNLVRGRKLGLTKELILFDAREYGLFLGSMLGIYNGWMFESRKYVKEFAFLKQYRGMLAGFGAGLSLLWVPHKKRWPIVLFTVVRAFELFVKLLARRKLVPTVANADVMLMSAASASMIHSWIFTTHTLDSTYRGFLTKQSQVPPIIRESIEKMYTGKPLDLEKVNEARKKVSSKPMMLTNPINYDSLPPGELLHPNQSFFTYVPKFFVKAMRHALPVYLPVFSVPILLFYPSALVKRPVETIRRVLSGVLRSSIFLSTYVTVGFSSVSVMRALGMTYANMGSLSQITFFLAGALGGCATQIEKKSRRIELALYVLSKAVESRWAQLVESGLIRPVRHGDVFVFMCSLAVIAHTFTRHRSMLRSSYSGLMAKFFDHDERHKFYTIPRIVSEQLLGARRNFSHRFLASLQQDSTKTPQQKQQEQ